VVGTFLQLVLVLALAMGTTGIMVTAITVVMFTVATGVITNRGVFLFS
jgi:hypothetical protein